MKVLVLGATGHIGQHLMRKLNRASWAVAVGTSRQQSRTRENQTSIIQVNTLDRSAMVQALRSCDAVVNCVAGSASSISEGAKVLVQAALDADCRRIVHMSSMAVYGPVEGLIQEDAPFSTRAGWYGHAKCEAESYMNDFRQKGGQAVILRPGCVHGPGSDLWVGRIGRWLQAGRMGDLGTAGDGWSNLVHVEDVCQAVSKALKLGLDRGEMPVFNLAAPDSPRWNEYFVDLALAIGSTPVRRIGSTQLQLESKLAGPVLKVAQRAFQGIGGTAAFVPDPIPPGLVRLWAQHIRLDAGPATRKLELQWTPYSTALGDCARWFMAQASRTGHHRQEQAQ